VGVVADRFNMADERRGLSYHEAGHAVVAWALGFRVIKVGIGIDCDSGPVTKLDPAGQPKPSQALIINRAGIAAEDLFEATTSSKGGFMDRLQAAKILKVLKRKKCEAKHDAYNRARKLLEANKEVASRVAEHLIEHGKIEGAEVERLLPFR
jgi:hypothetical protein